MVERCTEAAVGDLADVPSQGPRESPLQTHGVGGGGSDRVGARITTRGGGTGGGVEVGVRGGGGGGYRVIILTALREGQEMSQRITTRMYN